MPAIYEGAVQDLIDELGRLVFLNDAWKDLSGFELDSARQHPLGDCLHPDDRMRARDAIRALLAGDAQEWTDELRLRTLAKRNLKG